MEAPLFGGGCGIEKLAQEIRVAVFPIGRVGGTAQPAFLLQEMKKDQTAQELFDEIANWLQRLVTSLFHPSCAA